MKSQTMFYSKTEIKGVAQRRCNGRTDFKIMRHRQTRTNLYTWNGR
jgi:hypothetical protein